MTPATTPTVLAMVFGTSQPFAAPPPLLIHFLYAVQWTLLLFTAYLTLIPLAGFYTPRRRHLPPPASRFAIVTPAHDEALVVGNLVESCDALDYPRELFDVYVVADNCEDDTARVAAARGAQVFERRDLKGRGKGCALDYAFRRILSGDRRYDAVVVLDADNLVRPDFLRVMNAELIAGHAIVQGRVEPKNPDDTWVTSAFGLSVWVSNRFWYLAKYNLGFSGVLGGTGMCISCDVLRAIGWGTQSLVEDLEFTMKGLTRGIKTAWAHDAVVYDEKPLTFMQSWRQRLRWVQGQATVAGHYLPKLLWLSVRRGDLSCFEGALQILQPFYMLLSTGFMAASQLLVPRSMTIPVLQGLFDSPFWLAIYLVQFALPVAAVLMDGGSRRALRRFLYYPIFQYSWVPLTWAGILTCRQRDWVHTQHTRALTLSDLLSGRGTM